MPALLLHTGTLSRALLASYRTLGRSVSIRPFSQRHPARDLPRPPFGGRSAVQWADGSTHQQTKQAAPQEGFGRPWPETRRAPWRSPKHCDRHLRAVAVRLPPDPVKVSAFGRAPCLSPWRRPDRPACDPRSNRAQTLRERQRCGTQDDPSTSSCRWTRAGTESRFPAPGSPTPCPPGVRRDRPSLSRRQTTIVSPVRVVHTGRQLRPVGAGARGEVSEDASAADLREGVHLKVGVLVPRGHPGVANEIARIGCPLMPSRKCLTIRRASQLCDANSAHGFRTLQREDLAIRRRLCEIDRFRTHASRGSPASDRLAAGTEEAGAWRGAHPPG